jgi:FKBP-type peptidyl-prolyl cis-trans isomerase SlyD
MQVAKNTVVTIDYTLTNPAGDVLDSSSGGEPLSYLHGSGGIIPGLESALDGKSPGDELRAVVPPEQAYGARNHAMVQAVPRDRFQGAPRVEPGMQFQANTPQGPRTVTIVAADDQKVTVDANHPLAGVTLTFDVKVVDVRNATPEEVAHGHAHGPDGQHHH